MKLVIIIGLIIEFSEFSLRYNTEMIYAFY